MQSFGNAGRAMTIVQSIIMIGAPCTQERKWIRSIIYQVHFNREVAYKVNVINYRLGPLSLEDPQSRVIKRSLCFQESRGGRVASKHSPLLRGRKSGNGRRGCFCTRTSRMASTLASQDSATQKTSRNCCEPDSTIAEPVRTTPFHASQQEVTRGVLGP